MPSIEDTVAVDEEGTHGDDWRERRFRARHLHRADGARGVFGGQVVAQALCAAAATLGCAPGGWLPHALHALFLLPVQTSPGVVYAVERLRDGRTYCARRVTARQGGAAVFVAQVSFTRGAEGEVAHQLDAAAHYGLDASADISALATPAEAMAAVRQAGAPQSVLRAIAARPFFQPDVDVRLPHPPQIDVLVRTHSPGLLSLSPAEHAAARQVLYFCVPHALPDDPAVHTAVAAYVSDHMLLGTALRPAGLHLWAGRVSFMATVDHCVWMHRPFRVDAPDPARRTWLAYVMESAQAGGGRGLATGRVFAPRAMVPGASDDLPDYVHVMSVSQEGVVRLSAPSSI